MRTARPLTLLLALVAALALASCGSGEPPQEAQDPGGFQTENAQVAETEGIYLDLDGMKYQVQVSRQLNPEITADRDYFSGVPEEDRPLNDDQVWFGVWMRVENEVDRAVQSVEDFEIRDTQQNIYRPVAIGPGAAFAYRSTLVEAKETYPDGNTPAGERSPNGALLLFKVRRFSLDNRPLELVLTGVEEGREAIVSLDV